MTEQKELEPELVEQEEGEAKALTVSFDITSLEAGKINTKISNYIDQASRVEINNDEDIEKATSLVSMLKSVGKNAEKCRVDLVKPMNDQVKEINAVWKKSITKTTDTAKSIEGKMTVFLNKKKKKEAEARQKIIDQQEADAIAAAEAVQEDETIPEAKKEEVTEQIMEQAVKQTTAVSNVRSGPIYGSHGGSSSMIKKLDWELADKQKIPAKYHVINETLLRADIMELYRDAKSVGATKGLKGKDLAAHCLSVLHAGFSGVDFEFTEKVNVR